MGKRKQAQRKLRPDEEAVRKLKAHYLLGPVARDVYFCPLSRYVRADLQASAYCRIDAPSSIVYNDALRLAEPIWLGILSVATLVLALGGPKRLPVPDPVSDQAAQLAALHWWLTLKVGQLPEHFDLPADIIQWGRLPLEDIATRLRLEPPDELLNGAWSLTRSSRVELMRPGPPLTRWQIASTHQAIDHEQAFAQALVDNAKRALQAHHEADLAPRPGGNLNSTAAQAKRWLIAHYLLLGALLTQFELVEDLAVCRRMDIQSAAILVSAGEIYINPARGLTLEEAKFVVAHEVLHAGLCHGSRRQGRDAILWNVACDFVINDWLVGMGLGTPPAGGLLFDDTLRGWAAEDIYLRLAADVRIRRRLSTLRGPECDMLDDAAGRFFTDREEFCRRALMQGLDYHQDAGRGDLPAGLVEDIRTLNQPPSPGRPGWPNGSRSASRCPSGGALTHGLRGASPPRRTCRGHVM